MLFTSVLLSALAATSGAFARQTTKARRQDVLGPNDVKFTLSLTGRLGSISSTLNALNFPETAQSPELEDLFDTISFDSGSEVDPALRCRIFSDAAAGIDDTILVSRGTNLNKNSFSKGLPWTFSVVQSRVASIQCAVVEDVFFASPA